MTLLINKENVAKILQVAIGYNTDEFDVFIGEAQDFDFKPLVCEDFYYELIDKHITSEKWKKLLDGGSYDHNGITKSFRGLADVLSYFTYARFILKCNYVSTSHGFTIKKSPHSEPMSLEEKRNMYYKYQSDANKILKDTKIFIERNINDYESWNSCLEGCNGSRNSSGFKTTVIQ